MVGLSDVDGDHMASADEIIDMYAAYGVHVTEEEVDAFLKEADSNDDGMIDTWEFEVWLANEWYYSDPAVTAPKVDEVLRIAFATMDKNSDGKITYYDALDYAKFYLDTLASEGKIVRSWYPDEEVAWAVDDAMRTIMWTELPTAEKDQMVYALTMDTTLDPY